MIENPIFIIGTERSGSNLLRLILNSHPSISIPHPPHVMRDFKSMVTLYGNLENQENFSRLVHDVKKVVESHFSPWPLIIKADELKARSASRSLYGIYAALYDLYRQSEKKARFGCKSTFMFAEIETILAHHQDPKFIHLVRDPRDVAVSASQSIFSKYHPYKMAELWVSEQGEIEKWKYLIDENKMLVVRYEDLVTDSREVVIKIMNFLNEDFKDEQLQYFKNKEAKRLASLSQSWKNVESPISSSSVGQFKTKLNESDVVVIEAVCGKLMQEYAYQTVSPPGIHKITKFDQIKFEVLEWLTRWRVEFLSMFNDKNFMLRWKKKLMLKKMKWCQLIKGGV